MELTNKKPWYFTASSPHGPVYSKDHKLVVPWGTNSPEKIANAEFIVQACNSHDTLVEALKVVVNWHRENDSGEGELFGRDYIITCIAAINQAEGRD